MGKTSTLLGALLLSASGLTAQAQDEVNLTFSRTGSDASGISVNVTDENGEPVSGASATLTLKPNNVLTNGVLTSEKANVICPNQNKNANGSDIEFTISITGLPYDLTFNKVEATTWALTSNGVLQTYAGRYWNLSVQAGTSSDNLTATANLENFDLYNGPGNNTETLATTPSFILSSATSTDASGNLCIKFIANDGTKDPTIGCFIGLESINLSNKSTVTFNYVDSKGYTIAPSETVSVPMGQAYTVPDAPEIAHFTGGTPTPAVIDNPGKVSEYILTCRQMNIAILPPDINEGESRFSVSDGSIRYALSAIKSIGRPVVEAIMEERRLGGRFKSLTDFLERMTGKEVNKRVVENLIKAGALDSLGGTRQQYILAYAGIMDSVAQSQKTMMTGQMSLFDLVDEDQKANFQAKLPDVGEYPKELLLSFEKDVLGIYVSGHPLEEYEERWRKNITAVTSDFQLDEETNQTRVRDGQQVVLGGMITGKTVKYTKNNRVMAFLQLEDLLGAVEVVVFPNVYEKNTELLSEDAKVFVSGHVDAGDDRAAKLICDRIIPFEAGRRELWIQFPDQKECIRRETELLALLADSDGQDRVVLYAAAEKSVKRLPAGQTVDAGKELIVKLEKSFGEGNVKVVEKRIENIRRMQ